MKNELQPSMEGFSEYNERRVQHHHAEKDELSSVGSPEERILLDYLLELGFAWEEASKLLNLREHFYENAEVRQRLADNAHMQFARWLYERGEIAES